MQTEHDQTWVGVRAFFSKSRCNLIGALAIPQNMSPDSLFGDCMIIFLITFIVFIFYLVYEQERYSKVTSLHDWTSPYQYLAQHE